MHALTCPDCQHEVPAAAKFCSECGSQLNLKLCPHCEAVNERHWQSCHACGEDLLAQPSAEPLPSAPSFAPVQASSSEASFSPPPAAPRRARFLTARTMAFVWLATVIAGAATIYLYRPPGVAPSAPATDIVRSAPLEANPVTRLTSPASVAATTESAPSAPPSAPEAEPQASLINSAHESAMPVSSAVAVDTGVQSQAASEPVDTKTLPLSSAQESAPASIPSSEREQAAQARAAAAAKALEAAATQALETAAAEARAAVATKSTMAATPAPMRASERPVAPAKRMARRSPRPDPPAAPVSAARAAPEPEPAPAPTERADTAPPLESATVPAVGGVARVQAMPPSANAEVQPSPAASTGAGTTDARQKRGLDALAADLASLQAAAALGSAIDRLPTSDPASGKAQERRIDVK